MKKNYSPNQIREWVNKAGRTSGTRNTPEALQAIKVLKGYLKTALAPIGCTVVISTGHFYCSGFITRGERHVYFNSGDFRGSFGFYVRTAADDRDFTGGRNVAASPDDLLEKVIALLDTPHRRSC